MAVYAVLSLFLLSLVVFVNTAPLLATASLPVAYSS